MILVVDDEETVRKFVRKVLERAGYPLLAASSGEEALRTLQTATPDVLLIDIVMPGMSGLALAARAHQLLPTVPVIFMSGFADEYAQELSGSVCLSKPFTPSELLAAVRDIADARRSLGSQP